MSSFKLDVFLTPCHLFYGGTIKSDMVFNSSRAKNGMLLTVPMVRYDIYQSKFKNRFHLFKLANIVIEITTQNKYAPYSLGTVKIMVITRNETSTNSLSVYRFSVRNLSDLFHRLANITQFRVVQKTVNKTRLLYLQYIVL